MAFSKKRGRFVSTKTPIPGAHTILDERTVGIYHPTKVKPAYKLNDKEIPATVDPEHVAFQGADGYDVYAMCDDGHGVKKALPIKVAPEDLEDIHDLELSDHLPPGFRERSGIPLGIRLVP